MALSSCLDSIYVKSGLLVFWASEDYYFQIYFEYFGSEHHFFETAWTVLKIGSNKLVKHTEDLSHRIKAIFAHW
jgi:hypothetical protein